ncbi:HEPN domain-containing protein [Meiothermus sp. QL-1]|uniref:HEPN domain-containing protein n=1 Tax=Meiothermus sp. QL-1 TaxID=2058095 RepID=UPI000E0C89B2|nr:HEPN domain-containing protein [Meiothermus sp. QL-1]RDI96146.1 HEPN domain-containing protein [Meiothermus sp. QL-1]
MSAEKQRREALRWLRQAEDDLEAGHALASAGKYAQAAFFAQQAGEKALKAVWLAQDADPWGHSLGRLIREMPEAAKSAFDPLLDYALALDKLYIPTRYPDALAELTPAEAYTQSEAQTALAQAGQILQLAARWLGEVAP